MNFTEKEKNRLKERYGEWAVITGASSGIGLAIAERLAEAGFNIVINARDEKKLSALAVKLRSNYGIQALTIVADMSDASGIEKMIRDTSNLNVGLLMVSAGYGTSGLFLNSFLQTEINMLRVNCEALLSLTHHYCHRFAAQKRGGVILMSSMVAFQGVPYAANYAASKAYVQSLAEALHTELKEYKVDVLAASPGPVESGFGQRANMKMNMSLQPSSIAIPILKALGRKRTVLPGRLTKVMVYALRTLPRRAKIQIMKNVMGGMTKHQWQ